MQGNSAKIATVIAWTVGIGAIGIGLGISATRLRAQDKPKTPIVTLSPENPNQRRSGWQIPSPYTPEFNGVISGRVTLDGKPIAGIPVTARFAMHQTGARGEGTTVTDANGNYRITGLNPQDFRVQVTNGGKPYLVGPPQAIALHKLPKTTAENVNFALYLGPEITVRVRDAESFAPVPGIVVKTYPSDYQSRQAPPNVTDAKGEFRFRAGTTEVGIELDGGQTPPLLYAAPGYSFHYNTKLPYAPNLPPLTWEVRSYRDAMNPPPTLFHGVVTDGDGAAVPGANVRMVRSGTTEQWTTRTDSSGKFSFQTYRMTSMEYGNWNGEYKRGILFEIEKSGKRAIHFATPEETWSTIPIKMIERRAAVTGQVVDPQGKPLAGVNISYMQTFAGLDAGLRKEVGATDANGRFTIDGVLPDAYTRFQFGGMPQNGTPMRFAETRVPDIGYSNGWMRLKENEQRDLGRVNVLIANRSVSGRITNKDGSPAQGAMMVVVQGKHTRINAIPQPDGTFRAEGVADEPLMLYVFRSQNGHIFGTDPGGPDEAGRKPVRAGEESVHVVVRK